MGVCLVISVIWVTLLTHHFTEICYVTPWGGPVGHLRYVIAKNQDKNHPVITYCIVQVYMLPSLSLYPSLHHEQAIMYKVISKPTILRQQRLYPPQIWSGLYPVMLHRHRLMIAMLFLLLFLFVLVSFMFHHHMYGNTAKISFPHVYLHIHRSCDLHGQSKAT
jgi:hypothetical protein